MLLYNCNPETKRENSQNIHATRRMLMRHRVSWVSPCYLDLNKAPHCFSLPPLTGFLKAKHDNIESWQATKKKGKTKAAAASLSSCDMRDSCSFLTYETMTVTNTCDEDMSRPSDQKTRCDAMQEQEATGKNICEICF